MKILKIIIAIILILLICPLAFGLIGVIYNEPFYYGLFVGFFVDGLMIFAVLFMLLIEWLLWD